MSAAGAVAAALLLVTPGAAAAAPAVAPQPVEQCRIQDERLDELSGLASDGRAWYAVNDGGRSLRVHVLDPADCSVRDVRTESNDPYDVEDLALGRDGSLWLADIGDNRRRRDTIALHVMAPGGGLTLHRLAYPDGAHDAEALLLDRAGVPFIVTKEPLGRAGVYRPAEPLDAERTVPLERVGSVTVRSTKTPGGPLSGSFGSTLVTGGSVSHDGTAIAIRTYTDVYLYSAPDGDVAAALQREPLHIPLPNEPQGEAIAWDPDGTLLSASEGQEPVRRIPGAAGLLAESTTAPAEDAEQPSKPADGTEPATGAGTSTGQALLFAAVLAGLLVFLAGRLRRNR
ncbi:hypothetical protein LZ318_08235 [Saccharopolyspora indica]|uniref:hypothetical protein n=1 Tax=Saccharopolyspora indica TaxID=1229659 RepID=UPI0022EB48AB|nr:hypothetical protein [Saccharopolyspora indica]MDA3649624.1 hypothetical protein [Saccharopolyspora indica]